MKLPRLSPFFLAWPLLAAALPLLAAEPAPLRLTRAEYAERAYAAWVAQMAGVFVAWPHEHQASSVEPLHDYPKPYDHAVVDDDWYYEMSALRAFEKYGPGLTVAQLGEQWQRDVCGTWGASREARLLMARGIVPPDTGHPRYNHSWWTIGPQFSAEIYGLLAPGRPNLAAQLAREYGHINGYAEGVDGAVFVAGAVSVGFVETDPRAVVRQAARLIHVGSPYRACLDEIIAQADAGMSFRDIERDVIQRWAMVYPGTNNAVPNGGIIALSLWFGEGDFLKTVNLAASASDYSDADCNGAGAAAVVAAMHGLKAVPAQLIAPLHDRIQGDMMGDLPLPPVDESITALGRRTAAMGEQMLLAHGARLEGDTLVIPGEPIVTPPLERFTLADLTRYWAPGWTMERAGFGTTSGGRPGYGGTWLDDGVLTTWPQNAMLGLVLWRELPISAAAPHMTIEVAADPGRVWELTVMAGNNVILKQVIDGAKETVTWQTVEVDLTPYAGRTITVRLFQNLITLNRENPASLKPPSVAHWKTIALH